MDNPTASQPVAASDLASKEHAATSETASAGTSEHPTLAYMRNIDPSCAEAYARCGMQAVQAQSRRERMISLGAATQFKPGVSGNPGGRPKIRPITEAIEKILENPKECEKLAKKLVSKAKSGSIHHLREIMDRVEGKVIQQIEHTGNIVHEITEMEKAVALSSLQKIQALSSSCETPLLAEDVSEE